MKGLGGWIILAGGALVIWLGWKWLGGVRTAGEIVPSTPTTKSGFAESPTLLTRIFGATVATTYGESKREVGAGVGQVTPDHPEGIWVGPPNSAGTYSNPTTLFDPNNPGGPGYQLPPIATNHGGNSPSHG